MPYPEVVRAVQRYLAIADRLLPGRVIGYYVVGSAALGAFRPGRSDIDFVAVIQDAAGGGLADAEYRRLRLLQWTANIPAGLHALTRGRWTLPGTINGVFVAAGDLKRPVTQIRPLACHVGHVFQRGAGFNVNPVEWKVLREHGIAFRGPSPGDLGLDPEPDRLRAWNRENLHAYWRPWAEKILSGKRPLLPKRFGTAWGVLGPPRLHHTIATGEVISKEAAGEYALDVFPARWHPLIHEALAYRRGEPADPAFSRRAVRHRQTAEFVLEVIADADRRYPD